MIKANRLTTLILLTFLVFSNAIYGQNPNQKMNSKQIKLLVDSLCTAMNREYIYPDKATLMSNNIKSEYKKGSYNKAKNNFELGQLLSNDMQRVFKDGHLSIRFDPQLTAQLEKPWQAMTEAERQKQYEIDVKVAQEGNFAFRRIERLSGNIGYVRWDGFVPLVDEAKSTLDAAFKFVSNCRAIIIDMRYNGGGSPEMVLQIQNYFFNEKISMNEIISRANDTLKRYTDPSKTDFKLNMPVYILTGRRTFSAAEDFTFGMQYNKRAVVVGDTTGGGAHPTGSHNMGQGFVAFIPNARSPIDKDWESKGIIPNFAVPSDQALTKAQILIFTDLLSNSEDERVKNICRWNLNSLQSEIVKTPKTLVLSSYKGVYEGGLDFYIKDNQLYCKNAENGNLVTELKYIENNLFMLDDNVQVLFEKNSSGTYSQIKMLWKNGTIDERRRQ
jgi:hypothetical protein